MARETDPRTARELGEVVRYHLAHDNYAGCSDESLPALALLVEMAERGHAQNCGCHSTFKVYPSTEGKPPYTYYFGQPCDQRFGYHGHPYRDPRCSAPERKEGE